MQMMLQGKLKVKLCQLLHNFWLSIVIFVVVVVISLTLAAVNFVVMLLSKISR
jgi:hypothetical protein